MFIQLLLVLMVVFPFECCPSRRRPLHVKDAHPPKLRKLIHMRMEHVPAIQAKVKLHYPPVPLAKGDDVVEV